MAAYLNKSVHDREDDSVVREKLEQMFSAHQVGHERWQPRDVNDVIYLQVVTAMNFFIKLM